MPPNHSRRHPSTRPTADIAEGVEIHPAGAEEDADPARDEAPVSDEAAALLQVAQAPANVDQPGGEEPDEPEHVSPEAPRAPRPKSISEMAERAREERYQAARWDLRELFERLADLEDGAVPTGPDAAAVLALIDHGVPDALILEDLRPGSTPTRTVGLLEADRKPLAPARIESIIAKIRARRVALADARVLRDHIGALPSEDMVRSEIAKIDAAIRAATAALLERKRAAIDALEHLQRSREDLAAFEADAREAFNDPIVSTIFEGER